MRSMATTSCFTGHRIIDPYVLPHLAKRLDETIAQLIEQGVIHYGTGMAIGFDSLAAQAVARAKINNSAVKLIAVLPCVGQEQLWSETDQQTYRQLLALADKIVYVSKSPYYDGCMAKRNIHLVKNSGVCVAYCRYGHSGTGQTVRLARKYGLKIINLAQN